MAVEYVDLGGVNVLKKEHIRTVNGKTPGETRLVAYDMGWTEAIIECRGSYYKIDPLKDWLPEEMTETEVDLDICNMLTPETPHQRRKAHLDQIVGMVRRGFARENRTVSQLIVSSVSRSELKSKKE